MAIASVLGCIREVDIENRDAEVTSVGPLAPTDTTEAVVVTFTIRDFEGDDQNVSIQICDGPDDNCGTAAEAAGGDPLSRVTAVPRDTDVEHEFHWDASCGRWVGGELEAMGADQEFVVAVSLLPSQSEPVYSAPTTLAELGVSEGSCE